MIRHHRAFTITEVLFLLGILGVIALAGGQLFTSAIQLSQGSAEAQNNAASFDAAIAVLRSDTWSATAIDVADKGGVTIHLADGRSVVWSADSDSLWRRDEANSPRRWTVAGGAVFTVEDAELIVTVLKTKASRGGQIRMSSQVRLLAKIAS